MKILVVDDNKLNLKVADGFLKMYFPNYSVQLCYQPKLVMGILKQETIDIVLLDIMMPEISGIEILQDIRRCREFKDIQVLMLTAMVDIDSFKTCFEFGANDYLRKPIDITEFQARIKASANTRSNTLMLHELYERMKSQNNELKNVNTQLKDTQFHLIQSEKLAAIGELAAGVAHEINNPIGYVGSNLETMSNYLSKMRDFINFSYQTISSIKDSPDSITKDQLFNLIQEKYKKNKICFIMEDIEGIIKDSQDGIQKVAEIVKSLRNFARSGFEDEKIFCSVIEIIEQVLLIVRNEAKYSVEIKLNNCNIPDVYCNKGQVSQVLLNIIINAIQAIKSQKKSDLGSIYINSYKEDEYICISIKDDGPGISEENLSKVFNPFFTTKDVGQGTGLGLSISHDIIVKKHNGIMEVKSRVGVYTEFIVKLPLIDNMSEGVLK